MKIPFLTPKVALDLKDKDKKRVVWYKDAYEWHINNRHFDIKKSQDKLKKAVRTPQLKKVDEKRKATHYYYETRENRNGKMLYMEVIVDYNGDPAFIRTAHLTTNVKDAVIVLN